MIGTIIYISYIIYAVSLLGTVRSYIEKDIAPGCLSIFLLICPVVNTVIFILFVYSKSKAKETIRKIFTNNPRHQ